MHAYGETAKKIMAAQEGGGALGRPSAATGQPNPNPHAVRTTERQGRKLRGQPVPKRSRVDAEAAKIPVRQTLDKAMKTPGSISREELGALERDLHLLPRKEVRQRLDQLMPGMKGDKQHLVAALLAHVRGERWEERLQRGNTKKGVHDSIKNQPGVSRKDLNEKHGQGKDPESENGIFTLLQELLNEGRIKQTNTKGEPAYAAADEEAGKEKSGAGQEQKPTASSAATAPDTAGGGLGGTIAGLAAAIPAIAGALSKVDWSKVGEALKAFMPSATTAPALPAAKPAEPTGGDNRTEEKPQESAAPEPTDWGPNPNRREVSDEAWNAVTGNAEIQKLDRDLDANHHNEPDYDSPEHKGWEQKRDGIVKQIRAKAKDLGISSNDANAALDVMKAVRGDRQRAKESESATPPAAPASPPPAASGPAPETSPVNQPSTTQTPAPVGVATKSEPRLASESTSAAPPVPTAPQASPVADHLKAIDDAHAAVSDLANHRKNEVDASHPQRKEWEKKDAELIDKAMQAHAKIRTAPEAASPPLSASPPSAVTPPASGSPAPASPPPAAASAQSTPGSPAPASPPAASPPPPPPTVTPPANSPAAVPSSAPTIQERRQLIKDSQNAANELHKHTDPANIPRIGTDAYKVWEQKKQELTEKHQQAQEKSRGAEDAAAKSRTTPTPSGTSPASTIAERRQLIDDTQKAYQDLHNHTAPEKEPPIGTPEHKAWKQKKEELTQKHQETREKSRNAEAVAASGLKPHPLLAPKVEPGETAQAEQHVRDFIAHDTAHPATKGHTHPAQREAAHLAREVEADQRLEQIRNGHTPSQVRALGRTVTGKPNRSAVEALGHLKDAMVGASRKAKALPVGETAQQRMERELKPDDLRRLTVPDSTPTPEYHGPGADHPEERDRGKSDQETHLERKDRLQRREIGTPAELPGPAPSIAARVPASGSLPRATPTAPTGKHDRAAAESRAREILQMPELEPAHVNELHRHLGNLTGAQLTGLKKSLGVKGGSTVDELREKIHEHARKKATAGFSSGVEMQGPSHGGEWKALTAMSADGAEVSRPGDNLRAALAALVDAGYDGDDETFARLVAMLGGAVDGPAETYSATGQTFAAKSGEKPTAAVDLDGTLARYDGWKGADHFGQPLRAVAVPSNPGPEDYARALEAVRAAEEKSAQDRAQMSDDTQPGVSPSAPVETGPMSGGPTEPAPVAAFSDGAEIVPPAYAPAELVEAILRAKAETADEDEGEDAVDSLVDQFGEPETLLDFEEEADRNPFAPGGRAFGAKFAEGDHAGWTFPTSKRSGQMIAVSPEGKKYYGKTAQQIHDSHASGNTETPHIRPHKAREAWKARGAENEARRGPAREAVAKAIADPANLKPEELTALRDHLHSLTRDEVRKVLDSAQGRKSGAKADLVDALLAHVQGGGKKADKPTEKPPEPAAGEVRNVPTGELKVDPKRFQFKLNTSNPAGVTDELKTVKSWNPDFAGVLSTWKDPANGQEYIVNGHHRYELANRLGVPSVAVRQIKARNAVEARGKGALINIAEGRGTAIDAAKFMRDTGTTVGDFAAHGVPLKSGQLADQATALTKLSDKAFDRLTRGDLDQGRALAVAKYLPDHERQDKLFKLLDKRDDDDRETSSRTVEEMARAMAAAPSVTTTQDTLWGPEETTEDVFVQRAELAGAVRADLAKELTDYGVLGSQRRADRTADAGNMLNVEENRRRAEEAEKAKNLYDLLSNRKGMISDALNAGAVKLAQAKTKKERERARSETVDAVRGAIREEFDALERRTPAAKTDTGGEGGTLPGGGGTPEPGPTGGGDGGGAGTGGGGLTPPESAPTSAIPPPASVSLPLSNHASADHTDALDQIPPGQSAYVAGHFITRRADGKFQIETPKGYTTGDAPTVSRRIQDAWRQQAPERTAVERALGRAAAYNAPDWTDAAGNEAEAKKRAAVPHGARGVSLEDNTHGRVGTVHRDPETGNAHLKLEGGVGTKAVDYEPLDSSHSWRVERPKVESGPKAVQPKMFSADGAEFAAPPPGAHPPAGEGWAWHEETHRWWKPETGETHGGLVSAKTLEKSAETAKPEGVPANTIVGGGHEATAAALVAKSPHLEPETAKRYAATLASALSKMSSAARDLGTKAMYAANFHATPQDLTRAVEKESGRKEKAILSGAVIGGSRLHLDGDNGTDKAEGVYLHEWGHLVDEDNKFSGDPKWKTAWKSEIFNPKSGVPVMRYARLSESEGFAEMHRMIFSDGLEAARKHWPKCVKFFESKGLLK